MPSSSTRKPIDTTFSVPSPTGTHVGLDLAVAAAEAPFDTEHARHAEAPDVGVEHADGEAAGGQRGGEVHRDRRLADAALAARHREHAGGRRHLGRARLLARVEAGALHRRRLLLLGHLAVLDLDRGDAGEAPHLRFDVLADLDPQRAPGGGERDLHHDGAVGVDAHVVDHAEVDDARVQLGVDHPGQHAADVVGRRRGTGTGSWTGAPGSSGSGVRTMVINTGYILKICPAAGTVKP